MKTFLILFVVLGTYAMKPEPKTEPLQSRPIPLHHLFPRHDTGYYEAEISRFETEVERLRKARDQQLEGGSLFTELDKTIGDLERKLSIEKKNLAEFDVATESEKSSLRLVLESEGADIRSTLDSIRDR